MTTNLYISGVATYGATLHIRYRIVNSNDPWTVININANQLPYLIENVPEGDYEVQTSQTCTSGATTQWDPINVTDCSCTAPTITLGFVNNTSIQVYFTLNPGSEYVLYVDDIQFPIQSIITGSYLVNNLQPNRSYDIKLKRITSSGEECFSNVITAVTENTELCQPPTNLSYSINASDVLIAWDGSAVSYNVYVNGIFIANTINDNFLISGLLSNTQYNISVSSVCGSTSSAPAEIVFTTGVIVNCVVPSNLLVQNQTDTTISISWTNTITNQPIKVWANNNLIATLPANTTSYTLTGLTPATIYDIVLSVNCGNGDLFTAPLSGETDPTHDEIQMLSPVLGNKSVMLRWTGSPTALEYRIYKNGELLTIMGSGIGQLFYNVENLTPSTIYNFSIRPFYPQPGVVKSVTVETMASVCQPVNNLKITDIGNNVATAEWAISANNYEKFEVYLNDNLYHTFSNDSNNSLKFLNLNANTAYNVKVKSYCSNGGNSFSNTVTFNTTNFEPLSGLNISVDNDTIVEPSYEAHVEFNTDPNVWKYLISCIEPSSPDQIRSSIELINLDNSIATNIPFINPGNLLKYRPCEVKIESYTTVGELIVNTAYILFDIDNTNDPIVIYETDDLPELVIGSLNGTTLEFSIENETSVIGSGDSKQYRLFAMPNDSISGGFNVSDNSVSITTNSGDINLQLDKSYAFICKWFNITTNQTGYCRPKFLNT